ncbi:alternative sulfate transporter [Phlyctema vagabunda]|uniref:Alternative sulfate transporter n=1 Tax=Phlyctema vagabunda TaxID=108571 RepID=A0ABR4PSX0_9HELO
MAAVDSAVAVLTSEKAVSPSVHDATAENKEQNEAIVKDWTDAEERAATRKIDFILLPILGLAFFSLQLDRGNISAVLTSSILKDLNLTTDQINVGSQLLSAGIVLTEIPSNIVLQRVGPRVWLSVQILAWGLVATFQTFINSYASYLATRLLLGLLEGGFIPGALYYLSTWYKKSETGSRTTLYFFGQMFSAATSNLISSRLIKLHGSAGLSGWQWIFLVEGLITIFIGFLFIALVPPKAGDGKALIFFGRSSYFTERESYIIRNRVLLDDPKKARGNIKITGKDIWEAITNVRIIQHFFITLVAMTAFQGLSQYTPSLIKTAGFTSSRAIALTSVPVYCGMVYVFILSYLADKSGHIGPFVLFGLTWNIISYTCLRALPDSSGRWKKYGMICITNTSYVSYHILNISWLSVYCKTPQQRSVAMAVIIMAANAAGIPGSQIFRSDDAPKYPRGRTIICGLVAGAWVLALALNIQSYIAQRRAKRVEQPVPDIERESEEIKN